MYIEVYQLTYLRVLVLWALAVIFSIMTGILIYIYKEGFPLFRFCMVVVAVLYLALAYAKPDRLIASYNLSDRFLTGEQRGEVRIDDFYLNQCSCDAAVVIAQVMEDAAMPDAELRFRKFWEKMEAQEITPRTYNYSKARAQQLAKEQLRKMKWKTEGLW